MATSKAAVLEEFRVSSIQEAAMRVIARRGVAGTSMQAVAAEAGIAKGTIYLYFKGREELLEQTILRVAGQLTERLVPLLVATTEIPFDLRLRRMVTAEIEFFDEHRKLFRAYMAVCNPETGPGRSHRVHRKQYEEYLGRLADMLRAAMRRGEVHRADPGRLSLFLSEGVHAVIIRRISEERPPSPADEAAWIVTLLLHGLAKDGVR